MYHKLFQTKLMPITDKILVVLHLLSGPAGIEKEYPSEDLSTPSTSTFLHQLVFTNRGNTKQLR